MGNGVNDTVEPQEAKVNALSGPDKWIKFIKDLSAVAILQLMAMGAFYFAVVEIRPAMQRIPAIAEAQAIHDQHQQDFYKQHLEKMEESNRINRINCITYRELAKLSTVPCQGK